MGAVPAKCALSRAQPQSLLGIAGHCQDPDIGQADFSAKPGHVRPDDMRQSPNQSATPDRAIRVWPNRLDIVVARCLLRSEFDSDQAIGLEQRQASLVGEPDPSTG